MAFCPLPKQKMQIGSIQFTECFLHSRMACVVVPLFSFFFTVPKVTLCNTVTIELLTTSSMFIKQMTVIHHQPQIGLEPGMPGAM